MISCLHLNHFVTFESTLIDFRNGFTVITGETGAGKSLILQALAIVLGKSFPNGCVRQPAKKAELQAVFDLTSQPRALDWLQHQEIGCEDPTQIIVRREFADNNRQRSWINGQLVTMKNLAEFGELLLHFSPQHLQTKISSPDYQRNLFDGFCGSSLLSEQLDHHTERVKSLQRDLKSLQMDEQTYLQRRDILVHQKADLDQLDFTDFSYAGLMEERDQLKRRKEEGELLQRSVDLLDGNETQPGILEGMVQLQRHLANHPLPVELISTDLIEQVSIAESVLNKLSHAFSFHSSSLELRGDEYELIESKITLFKRLERKYGYGDESLRQKYSEICEELERLGSLEKQIQTVEQEIKAEIKTLATIARQLQEKRELQRPAFESRVTAAIQSLDIPKARFVVTYKSSEFSDRITLHEPCFLFDANSKEPVAIHTRASGGELARMALALSAIAHETSATGICLFDEIDTGMSGNTLHTLAQYLGEMGSRSQVLLVSHQAIVASAAEHHLFVSKCQKSVQTKSECKELERSAREKEISRLLDGGQSTRSLDVAKDLIQSKS